jgi:arylsulfatase A-like enzyme
VLVTLDTTRADALGCYGGPRAAATPVLDSLAAAGLRYASAWSPSPLTLPSHASLLTGLDPGGHGLRDNGIGRLDPGTPVLAAELRAAGYTTGAFVASRVLDRRFGLDRSFDHYDDRMAAERVGEFGYPERDAAAVVDAALAWWQAVPPDRPRFLWVHFYDPHAPYGAPGGAPAPPLAAYAAEVAFVDRELSRLLLGLGPRPRLLAVAGDHGEGFGEHGEEGHGLLLHRETLEVPLLLHGPRVPRGVVTGPVATRRLAATLLSLLGLPSRLPGPPLPQAPGAAPAEPILHETLFPASAYGWAPLAAVTGGPLRYVHGPAPELYDLARDPGERENRAAAGHPDLRPLQRELASYLRQHPLALAPAPPPDPETAAALRSLGYLSGATGKVGTLDPKEGLELLERLEAARRRLDRGEGAAAVVELKALVARSPDSVPFLSPLAAALAATGRTGEALLVLDRALARSPHLDFLHLQRAEALRQAGRRQEAEQGFRRALELDPRSARAWLALAEMALRAGEKDGEERLLRSAVAAGTSSAAILARLAQIELARGDLAAADGHLQEATELLPAWPVSWRLWADVAERQGHAALAAERRRRAGGP